MNQQWTNNMTNIQTHIAWNIWAWALRSSAWACDSSEWACHSSAWAWTVEVQSHLVWSVAISLHVLCWADIHQGHLHFLAVAQGVVPAAEVTGQYSCVATSFTLGCVWVRAECVRCPWAAGRNVGVHYKWYFFSISFVRLTQILGFQSKKSIGDPPYPPHYAIFGRIKGGNFQRLS